TPRRARPARTTPPPYTTPLRSAAVAPFPVAEQVGHEVARPAHAALEHREPQRGEAVHDAAASHAFAKALILGGVVHRFPSLRFRSEEHTSELQSRGHLGCRLWL